MISFTIMKMEIQPEAVFGKAISIRAPLQVVWAMLTQPALMKKWMSETAIDIETDWVLGHTITIRGQLYKKPFRNTGRVIAFVPMQQLQYSHLSSLSRLPDEPQSYTTFSFTLSANGSGETLLGFTAANFPTSTIYSHLAFYWNVALELLKQQAENISI